MREQRKVKRKFQKVKISQVLAVVLVCTLALLGIGGSLFAKYYANTSNKGVTTASNCYFTSNLLKDVTGQETGEYESIYNTSIWEGKAETPCVMDLEICNYQSQILYNDKNLNLTYQITFELAGASDGGTYQVTYGSQVKKITAGNPVTFSNITLNGGKAEDSLFRVSFTAPAVHEPNYTSQGIKVTATTTSPDYAKGRTLGGVLYASVYSSIYSLEAGFEFEYDDLENMAAYPYKVTYTPGLDGKEHHLEISWNSDSLELDYFSYQNYPITDGTAENGTNIKTLSYTIQPYATLNLVFYQKGSLTITDSEELEALVTVIDKDHT